MVNSFQDKSAIENFFDDTAQNILTQSLNLVKKEVENAMKPIELYCDYKEILKENDYLIEKIGKRTDHAKISKEYDFGTICHYIDLKSVKNHWIANFKNYDEAELHFTSVNILDENQQPIIVSVEKETEIRVNIDNKIYIVAVNSINYTQQEIIISFDGKSKSIKVEAITGIVVGKLNGEEVSQIISKVLNENIIRIFNENINNINTKIASELGIDIEKIIELKPEITILNDSISITFNCIIKIDNSVNQAKMYKFDHKKAEIEQKIYNPNNLPKSA